VDSVESALNATRGGASRLEVCSCLEAGGLTPTPGLIKVISSHVAIPCFALLRPRAGDFIYSDNELDAMCQDIDYLLDSGARGIVLGCLMPEGCIDVSAVKRLMKTARAKKPTVEFTFHRAIDLCRDILIQVRLIEDLGITRILTSGGKKDVMEGVKMIRQMSDVLSPACVVMPGGGVNESNLEELMTTTRCHEYHFSARVPKDSAMEWRNEDCSLGSNSQEYSTMVCSKERVEELLRIYKNNVLEIYTLKCKSRKLDT